MTTHLSPLGRERLEKITKGKWTARTSGDSKHGSGGQIYAGKTHIATCHYGHGVDVNERIANAVMMCAAPKMYAMLFELHEWILSASGMDADTFVKASIELIEQKVSSVLSEASQ